jgi:hypothetical protein
VRFRHGGTMNRPLMIEKRLAVTFTSDSEIKRSTLTKNLKQTCINQKKLLLFYSLRIFVDKFLRCYQEAVKKKIIDIEIGLKEKSQFSYRRILYCIIAES